MTLNIILALASNNAIGYSNKLPWNIPEDLRWFKTITNNKTIIMGKNTFKSLNNKALPNRKNIVVTSQYFTNDNITFYNINQTKAYIEKNQDNEDIFIIGGTSLYDEFIDTCDFIYVTYIYKDYEADTYYKLDTSKFEIHSMSDILQSNDTSYQHFIYKKKDK
jgi:dihydrofolate reductase